jgi:diacylglycerol kinase (ATP)
VLPEVLARLGAADRPLKILSAGPPDAVRDACRAAVRDGAAALVTIGGDGTVHLGFQAVAGTGIPFGVVPAGTGNDFARELGLPADPLTAADKIVSALRDATTRDVDLARLTGPDGTVTWYGAVLAAGFDALVNERANRMRFPRGRNRYHLAVLAELSALRARRYTLVLDGVAQERDAVIVAVGNTASYGGGMRICPAADPTDGLLDVVVADPLSRTTLMRIKPWLRDGTHVEHPAVHTFRARRVSLAAEGIVGYADGERIGPLPLDVEAVPGALRLLSPPGRPSGPAAPGPGVPVSPP